MDREERLAALLHANENTLAVLVRATKALKQQGRGKEASELTEKVFQAQSQEEALLLMIDAVDFE